MTSRRHLFSRDLSPSRPLDTVSVPLLDAAAIRRHGHAAATLETGRTRLLLGAILFFCAFLAVGVRLADLSLMRQGAEPSLIRSAPTAEIQHQRADIVDRNGVLLATSLPTDSLYADPSRILDVGEAVAKIRLIFPTLDQKRLRRRLSGKGRFTWIKRGLTPRQTDAVNRLGVPGLYFKKEQRRLHPQGRLAAHAVGFTDIDQSGLAGVERGLNDRLFNDPAPLALSLDMRLQHVLREEMTAAFEKHTARGAAGLILDVRNGELLALVSLPDFDPNDREDMTPSDAFNRATLGVYEMGSTLKPFTVAMALDGGVAGLNDQYDARHPLRISRFLIKDHRSMGRWLSVPEILIHSSNIGAAQIALDVGAERQKEFLRSAGLLHRPGLEITEIGKPIIPEPWRDINVMTVGFGHGLAINAVQLASGIAALTNGGILRPATLLKQAGGARPEGERLISEKTSRTIRGLLRMVVSEGTAGKADVAGYRVGGKTGTAEKVQAKGYERQALLSSFAGVFPSNDPRYLVLTIFDEPLGTEETLNRATGGWVAAPAAGRVIARIGPMLNIPLQPEEDEGGPPPVHLATGSGETILASF